jgi:signal transduction histidine kinase
MSFEGSPSGGSGHPDDGAGSLGDADSPGAADSPGGDGSPDRGRSRGGPKRSSLSATDGYGGWRGAADARRGRRRPGAGGRWPRYSHWPGAVIAALSFHVFGNWSQAAQLAHPRDIIACTLLLIGPLALAWRRRAPIVVLAVSSAATIGFATLSTPSWTYAVAPVIALFTAVRDGRRRPALVVAAVGYLAYLTVTWFCADLLGLPAVARPTVRDAVLAALGLALTTFFGNAARARTAYLAELAKANAERARAREEQERRQAADERLRIARELHDVLGHHLSLINVQAGVGLHLMDNRPEQAREALTAIKTASSEALREVRAVLGVLRPEEEAAPRQPAPGLDRLTDLTADAGLPVTTQTVGERRDLPAEVDRAAYRIVQEALTNVRRHATTGAAATVTVEYAPAELRLTIRNDGPQTPQRPAADAAPGRPGRDGTPGDDDPAATVGPAGVGGTSGRTGPSSGSDQTGPANRGGPSDQTGPTGHSGPSDQTGPTGRSGPKTPTGPAGRSGPGGRTDAGVGAPDDRGSGIAGMRARAASLGGSLEAGPLPGGGYLVSAVLPTISTSTTTSAREPA